SIKATGLSPRPAPTLSVHAAGRPARSIWVTMPCSLTSHRRCDSMICAGILGSDEQTQEGGMEVRYNSAHELGEMLTVVGSKLRQGDSAPDFAIDSLD